MSVYTSRTTTGAGPGSLSPIVEEEDDSTSRERSATTSQLSTHSPVDAVNTVEEDVRAAAISAYEDPALAGGPGTADTNDKGSISSSVVSTMTENIVDAPVRSFPLTASPNSIPEPSQRPPSRFVQRWNTARSDINKSKANQRLPATTSALEDERNLANLAELESGIRAATQAHCGDAGVGSSTMHEPDAVLDEQSADPEHSSPPKSSVKESFTVPPRGRDRLTQPTAIDPRRFNFTRQMVGLPVRQPVAAAAASQASDTTRGGDQHISDTSLATAGFGLLAGQSLVNTGVSTFNALVSGKKKHRYDQQLGNMLKSDTANFEREVASGNAADGLRKGRLDEATLAPTQAIPFTPDYPSLDTLILTKKGKGKLEYDWNKLRTLAQSKDVSSESQHAKHVLLTNYIGNELADKQMKRGFYDAFRHSLSAAGAIGAAVATHGASESLRGVSYALAGAGNFDPSSIYRRIKLDARNQKEQQIRNVYFAKQERFIQENKLGVTKPAFTELIPSDSQDPTSLAIQHPEKTFAVKDIPPKALDGVRIALLDQAVQEVDKQNFFGVKGRRINHEKSYVKKKAMREEMVDYAFDVLNDKIGTHDPKNFPRFRTMITPSNGAGSGKQDASFEQEVQKDPGLSDAYQLLRDMGAGRRDALQAIRDTMQFGINQHNASDPTTKALMGGYDSKAKDVVKLLQRAGANRGTSGGR